MVISFFGAAQTVTGTKHLITLGNGKRILLDCGMLQGGKGKDKSNKTLPFPAASIHALVLSHAHIDHSGLVPLLIKEGFEGKIYCTPATAELAQLILEDSAKIQSYKKSDASEENHSGPLYTKQDVEKTVSHFHHLDYDIPLEVAPGATLTFTDAGHILGSAVVNLQIEEKGKTKNLCFTGDLGRYCNRILRAPMPAPAADYMICESTYGDQLHRCVSESEDELLSIVTRVCVEQKGKLLVPAFSLGRTQELIYSFNRLAENHLLPDIPVFVDSPLSVYATEILKNNPQYFNQDMKDYIVTDPDPFGFPQLKYISESEHSQLINASREPCIIIASSGMMEGGRIRQHLKSNLSDARNGILVTGYCEPSTLGGRLSSGEKLVEIDDESYQVNAEIIFMKEYSAHGDYSDILQFLSSQDKAKLKAIFLVHGEKRSMEKLKVKLEEKKYKQIEMPAYRANYEL